MAIPKGNEAGSRADNLCRRRRISSAPFYACRKKFAGMAISDATRLRQFDQPLPWGSPAGASEINSHPVVVSGLPAATRSRHSHSGRTVFLGIGFSPAALCLPCPPHP